MLSTEFHVHRPEDELASIVQDARALGARTVWCENGSDRARQLVDAGGLVYVDAPPILDVARGLREPR